MDAIVVALAAENVYILAEAEAPVEAEGTDTHAAEDAGHAAEEEHASPGLLDIHASMIVWTWVSFILLLVILTKFAWKPIAKALDARNEGIEGDIAEAKRLRDEAEVSRTEYEAQLAKVREEMELMRDEARKQAETLKQQIEAAAHEEAQELKARAEREIGLEKNRVIGELRNQAVELALAAAEKVVAHALTDEDHRRLATEVVDRIDTMN